MEIEKIKKRVDEFLTFAYKHNIKTMLILFCDCFFSGKEHYLGKGGSSAAILLFVPFGR